MKTQASLLHPALILALTVLAAATPLAQAAESYVAYVGPITVDTAPPSLTCPSGVTVASDLGQCYATGVALGSPLASDNSGTVTATNNAPAQLPVGMTVVIWTAFDPSGNTNTCTQTVTVVDTTPPTVSCPVVPGASADASCQAPIPAVLATPSDACPGIVTVSQYPLAGTQVGLGTHTITVTATDAAGNSASCTTTLTVTEDTPPVIHSPSNMTVEFDSEAGAVVTYSVTASDNCDATPVVTCAPPSGSQFPIGATSVHCTASDASGNAASCSFTVTVLGARGAKENVLAELIALRATVTDPEDGRKLDEAIEHLTKSLAAELWVDQTHLERKHGDKVFHEEKETVKKLCELIRSNKSNIPDAVLHGFADRMFRADRLLASIAIQEAVAAGVAQKKIDQATKELAQGDAETGDDKCANGIEDYKSAWKHAVRAKVSPPIAPSHGRLQLEVLGEPGERFTIQASSNLVDWVTLGIRTANGEGVVTFEDADAGRHAVRYYRAVSQ